VFAGVGVGCVDLLLNEEDVGGPAVHEGVCAGELGRELGEQCRLAGEGAWGGGQEQVAGDFVQHVQRWACIALGVGVLAELAEAFHGFVDQVACGELGGGWLFEAEFVPAEVTGWAAEVCVEFGEREVQRGCAFAGAGGWCGRGWGGGLWAQVFVDIGDVVGVGPGGCGEALGEGGDEGEALGGAAE